MMDDFWRYMLKNTMLDSNIIATNMSILSEQKAMHQTDHNYTTFRGRWSNNRIEWSNENVVQTQLEIMFSFIATTTRKNDNKWK